MPATLAEGKPVRRWNSYTIASSGLLTTMQKALGQCFLALSATLRMIGTLTATRSSRDWPGLRGMPAVMISTSAPAQSDQLEEPTTLESLPESALACSRSRALPFANPSFWGMSNSTTSPSCLLTSMFASSPPIFPEPIKAIFLRAIFATRFFLTNHLSEITAPAQPRQLDAKRRHARGRRPPAQ